MFRGSYTAGSVAFLLLSTTLPAFCLRIFPRNARKRRGGRIALAPASCIQNRPGFHHGNRGGSFALWVLFSGAHTKPCEGSFGKPRVCGEKILCFFHGLGLPGSPPHMRGKVGSGPIQSEAPLQGKKAAASLSSVPLTAPKIRFCPSAVNGPAQIRQSPKIVPSFLCKNAPASCCGNRGVYNILLSLMLSAPHAITCGGS